MQVEVYFHLRQVRETRDSVAPFVKEAEFDVLLVRLTICLPGPKTLECVG